MENYDTDFYEIIYDEFGNAKIQLKQQTSKKEDSSNNWISYDTSHGHCGLCGRLGCNGKCF